RLLDMRSGAPDEGARSVPMVEHAILHEGCDGTAQRRARYVEQQGQLALAWQEIRAAETAIFDFAFELGADLPIAGPRARFGDGGHVSYLSGGRIAPPAMRIAPSTA